MSNTIVFSNKPISISTTPAADSMNNKTSRRLHIGVNDINEIPAELFEVKISQSKNPAKAGKVVFKYLTFRAAGTEDPRQDFAPTGVTTATPVADIKAQFVNFLAQQGLNLEFSVNINMLGNFGNINIQGEQWRLFDNEEFPETEGNPGYYLKSGTVASVTLTERPSNYGGFFYNVALSTDQPVDDVFVKAGRAKVWGQDDASFSAQAPVPPVAPAAPIPPVAPEAPANNGNIWG